MECGDLGSFKEPVGPSVCFLLKPKALEDLESPEIMCRGFVYTYAFVHLGEGRWKSFYKILQNQ